MHIPTQKYHTLMQAKNLVVHVWFGGLWKHPNKPACTKSIRVFKVPMYRRRRRRREQVAADAGAKKVTILSDTKLKGKKQQPLTLYYLADQAKGMR